MNKTVGNSDLNTPIYEQIGKGYTYTRQADPRWEAQIHGTLQGYRTLLNVGAGSGSYEPNFMNVVAIEPSQVMILQRSHSAAPVVRANAELLPFRDSAFDVAMAVLTTHHWTNAIAGLLEMRRVARSLVFVTWDPSVFAQEFWLVRDYLPEIEQREQQLATLSTILDVLGAAEVSVLNVPRDCMDGVLGAYWQRPEAYLFDTIRRAMSGIAMTNQETVTNAMENLRADLTDGSWRRRNAKLLALEELDLGYRLLCFDG